MSDDGFRIREGAEYLYTVLLPRGCLGHRYRVLAFILDVPSLQQKVLVQALTGPDAGLLFSVSPANFATRYEPVPEPVAVAEPEAAVAEKVAGHASEEWRTGI